MFALVLPSGEGL